MSDDKSSKSFVITQRNGAQHTVIVDADRYDEIIALKPSAAPETSSNSGGVYINIRVNGKVIGLHRWLTNCPKGMVVDHLNHSPLDNRLCNLRVCTPKENAANRRPWWKKEATHS